MCNICSNSNNDSSPRICDDFNDYDDFEINNVLIIEKLNELKSQIENEKQKRKKLKEKYKTEITLLHNEIDLLREEIKYMPNGSGYQEAKEHFDSCRGLAKKW